MLDKPGMRSRWGEAHEAAPGDTQRGHRGSSGAYADLHADLQLLGTDAPPGPQYTRCRCAPCTSVQEQAGGLHRHRRCGPKACTVVHRGTAGAAVPVHRHRRCRVPARTVPVPLAASRRRVARAFSSPLPNRNTQPFTPAPLATGSDD